MTINCINVNDRNTQTVEQMKTSLERAFQRISGGQASIIADFPKISNSPIDYFVWIRIPYGCGGYRAGTDPEYKNRLYLNTLAFTVRIVDIPELVRVEGSTVVKTLPNGQEGEWDLLTERIADSKEIERFVQDRAKLSYFKCPEAIWLRGHKSTEIQQRAIGRMIFFDDTICRMDTLIDHAAEDVIAAWSVPQRAIYSFSDKADADAEFSMSALINQVIEAANEGSEYGILTRKKLEAISRLVKNTERTLEAINAGGKMCLITGKAGSGKTLALARAMYQIARSGHHARFMTYNHMLEIDMKQTLRAMALKEQKEGRRLDSSNITCQTLHSFFFDLSARMDVLELVSQDRMKELQSVCSSRIALASSVLREYLVRHHGELPKDEKVVMAESGSATPVAVKDRKEVMRCLGSVIRNLHRTNDYGDQQKRSQAVEDCFRNYEISRMSELANMAVRDVFFSDYFKVLEVLYAKIVQPEEFLYKKAHLSRKEFLEWVSDVNPNATDHELYADVSQADREQLKQQIRSARNKFNWSNTIFIDEGQDCNLYEKLIIQHLKGHENLVVASGGSDQLIRTSDQADWTLRFGGRHIDCEKIALGKQTHRQKSNIVNFANRVAALNGYPLGMDSDTELDGVGSIIVDARPASDGVIPADIVSELKENGNLLGYSQYESMLFLLPIRGGYVSRKNLGRTVMIDEDDNVTEEDIFGSQTIGSEVNDIKMWKGVGDAKTSSAFPQHSEARFIYYESCRGLEACNLLCLDFDRFYEDKKNSREADRYILQNTDLFSSEEELRQRFATIWCTMALTRAIDTLYIKLKDPSSPFSQMIISAASEIRGSRVLY